MTNEIDPESRITIRPHYDVKGHDVFFMASSRPVKSLNKGEHRLFENLKAAENGYKLSDVPVEDLLFIETLLNERLADKLAPVSHESEHHLVVIEPHMDDAILSVGGQLLLRKGKCKITIVCVFGVSNYTSYMEVNKAFLDSDTVSKIRYKESKIAASMVGADFISLGFSDAPLRMQQADKWSENFLAEDIHNSHGFISSQPMPHVVKHIASALEKTLSELKPDEVWIPMGLGNHIDHKTTRTACLQTVSSSGFNHSLLLHLYEDLPYSRPAHCRQILEAFKDAGSQLSLKTADISEVMQHKIKAVGAFASQFKLPFMEPRLAQAAAEAAAAAGFSGAGERYYCLTQPFQIPDEITLSVNSDQTLRAKTAALKFSRELSKSKPLTVLVLPSGIVGSLPELTFAINRVHPNSKVNIYLLIEKDRKNEPTCFNNITTQYFLKNSKASVLLLAKVFLAFGQPMIMVRCEIVQISFISRLVMKALEKSRRILITSCLSDVAAYWESA
jgi:LmbE family N-acetylglucosaminyl deacetylase